MRLNILIEANEVKLENEKMQFVSLIKKALSVVDEEYFKSLYYNEDNTRKKLCKDFTWSIYYKSYDFVNQTIKLKDDMLLKISSMSEKFITTLCRGLRKKKYYNYKNYKMHIKSFELEEEKDIYKEECIFKTLMPFSLSNDLNVDSQEFQDRLNYVMNDLLERIRGFGLKKKLVFTSIKIKSVLVKENIHYENQYRQAWKGLFKLEGSSNDLQDIYILGLGNRRSQGFGLLELVR